MLQQIQHVVRNHTLTTDAAVETQPENATEPEAAAEEPAQEVSAPTGMVDQDTPRQELAEECLRRQLEHAFHDLEVTKLQAEARAEALRCELVDSKQVEKHLRQQLDNSLSPNSETGSGDVEQDKQMVDYELPLRTPPNKYDHLSPISLERIQQAVRTHDSVVPDIQGVLESVEVGESEVTLAGAELKERFRIELVERGKVEQKLREQLKEAVGELHEMNSERENCWSDMMAALERERALESALESAQSEASAALEEQAEEMTLHAETREEALQSELLQREKVEKDLWQKLQESEWKAEAMCKHVELMQVKMAAYELDQGLVVKQLHIQLEDANSALDAAHGQLDSLMVQGKIPARAARRGSEQRVTPNTANWFGGLPASSASNDEIAGWFRRLPANMNSEGKTNSEHAPTMIQTQPVEKVEDQNQHAQKVRILNSIHLLLQ